MLRLRTVPEKSTSRYRREIEALVQQEQMDLSQVDGAVICSVVPALVSVLSAVVRELTGVHPYLVTPTSDTGLTLAIEEPNTLGCDIIAADTAAAEDYPLPVVVFDMGTATTVTVVDADRRYIGGAILPGVKLGLRALFSGTAQLPNVPIQAPPRAICSATIEALQSGAVFGAAAMMDGLVDRFEAELGRPLLSPQDYPRRGASAAGAGQDLPPQSAKGLTTIFYIKQQPAGSFPGRFIFPEKIL